LPLGRISSMCRRRGAGKRRAAWAFKPALVLKTAKRGSSTWYSLGSSFVGTS